MQGRPSVRVRGTATLFGGVAMATMTYFGAFSVAPVIAEDILGSATWGGLPGAAAVSGTGAGAAVLGRVMARHGRRRGLVVGYGTAVAGTALALVAVATGVFVAFVAGMFVLAFGHSSNLLARYAAADLYPRARRAFGLGLVVWAATVGAAVGPNLLGPLRRVATALQLPSAGGIFLAGLVLFALSGLAVHVFLRPDPSTLRDEEVVPEAGRGRGHVWARPEVQVAVCALVASQVVMVLVMTMTPVHIRSQGGDIGAIGVVMSAHFVGMYGLAPLTGYLGDRVGTIPVIGLGFAVLAASTAAAATPLSGVALAVPLFGLGLGWSLSFVAASALLTEGMPYTVAARLQGTGDTIAWLCAAVASVASGVLLSAVGFAVLCLVGAALMVVPAGFVALRRGAVAPAPTTP